MTASETPKAGPQTSDSERPESKFRYAIATASYRGDLERCRLLCASVDHLVSNCSIHYLLVDDVDVALFRELEGPRRKVVPDSELLPRWLRSYPDPFSLGRRRVWTGAGALARGVRPFRGWQAQQLRKLMLPQAAGEDVFLHVDSDIFFVRPFDMASLVGPEGVRLYQKPGGITADMHEHVEWCRATARLLALPEPTFPCDDYIGPLVTWTKANTAALKSHIERVSGKDWISCILNHKARAEYIVYGFFVDRVLGTSSGHHPSAAGLARECWSKPELPPGGLKDIPATMAEGQVAILIQSFIGSDIDELWSLFRAAQSAEPPASTAACS